MNADDPNIGVQLAPILERLRKRQAPVAIEEIDKAVATFAGIAEYGVINDWLTGWWHLSRYEHRAAFNALRHAHEAVAALAWAAPASARLFELSFDVRMALIEAHIMLTDFDAARAQAAILVDESRSTDDRHRQQEAEGCGSVSRESRHQPSRDRAARTRHARQDRHRLKETNHHRVLCRDIIEFDEIQFQSLP